jgi:flagellar hook-length control protein FliK
MNDMLAVLLGAGGGTASQTIAALASGKLDVRGAQAGGAESGLFVQVLSARLTDGVGPAVQAVPGALLPEETLPEVLPAAEAEEQVEGATLNAQWAPGETLPLTAQEVQAAMLVPLAQGQDLAISLDRHAATVAMQGMALSPDLSAGRGFRGEGMGRAAAVAPALQMEAGFQAGAADAAMGGQLLPSGRERLELPAQPPRLEVAGGQLATSAMTVAQHLAVQPAAAEFLAGVSTQAGQAIAPGVAHGIGVMGEMQGRPAPATVHMAIEAPVRGPMFPQELGERIVWLSARQGQMADIALNPPHLGPLEVKLSLSGGEAGAQFFSPHPQVREAIEAALPRLREMLAEAGVTLGQAQVREESFSRQESLAQGDGRQGVVGHEDGVQGGQSAGLEVRGMGLGLVDVYV